MWLAGCYRRVLLPGATAGCYRRVLLPGATAGCYCGVLLRGGNGNNGHIPQVGQTGT